MKQIIQATSAQFKGRVGLGNVKYENPLKALQSKGKPNSFDSFNIFFTSLSECIGKNCRLKLIGADSYKIKFFIAIRKVQPDC